MIFLTAEPAIVWSARSRVGCTSDPIRARPRQIPPSMAMPACPVIGHSPRGLDQRGVVLRITKSSVLL